MKTILRTDLTVEEICEGFEFSKLENKGLFGWDGKLTIQPEYQRNYLYQVANREEGVVQSVLRGYPIGLLYFNKIEKNKFEVLDGQQRITSLGRFIKDMFSVDDEHGNPQYFGLSLPEVKRKKILSTPLTIYICEGTEDEIKQWYKTINIVGIALNKQEIANAIYSGSFITAAKAEFSNSQNSQLQMRKIFVKGDVQRQEILRTALEWLVKSSDDKKIEAYLSLHRRDENIDELKNYFDCVTTWGQKIFPNSKDEMCGLNWGQLYELYHKNFYDVEKISADVEKLFADEAVTNKRGIFEYLLSGKTLPKLLHVRVFENSVKKSVYAKQTKTAQAKDISNCPICAANNSKKIWLYKEMDADHVTAWSKGGRSDISNCQMLCKNHNRSKGNA